MNNRIPVASASLGFSRQPRFSAIAALATIIGVFFSASVQGNPVTNGRVVVDAKSNIFWAGQAGAPTDGVVPVMVQLPPGQNRTMQFINVTGETDCGLGIKAGPDGGTCALMTDVEASVETGIGGLTHPSKTMFLVGVFLDDSSRGTPPPTKFDAAAAERRAQTAPSLRSVFFIGDGLTGGERHVFYVPRGATRLFLGFVDAWDGRAMTGRSWAYFDNTGSLAVDYRVVGDIPTPTPRPTPTPPQPAPPVVPPPSPPPAAPVPSPTTRRLGVAVSTPVGAYVSEVEPGSVGERAGLRPGDIIFAIDERPITRAEELVAAIAQPTAGDRRTIRLLRAGAELTVDAVWTAPRPQQAPPVTASAQLEGLRDGVYLRTQMFGSSLFTEVFQIAGNRIASGPKRFLKESEFLPENANKVGSIRTEGGRVLIRWGTDEKESSSSYAAGNDCPNFAGGIVCRVETFRPEERVTGTFSGTIGSSAVSQSIRLQLNGDGTYTLRRTGIVNAPSTGGVSEGVETGRYSLADSSLRLQPDGREPRDYLVFPYPSKDPKWLWFGDRMLDGAIVRSTTP